MKGWLRCLLGRHRWLNAVWTGSTWLSVCDRGHVRWSDANPTPGGSDE